MNDKEVEHFTETTKREARWWDWIGRILPLVAICTIAVLHYFKMHDIRDMFLDVAVIVFFTVCFIWWYWAIKKIVYSAKYMQSTQQKFAELVKEIKKFKKESKDLDSNR